MPTLLDRADFTYGNTRLRARRTSLLGARLEQLPHRDLRELLAALDQTPYGPDVDAAPHGTGLEQLLRAVDAHLARALRATAALYEGSAQRVVGLLLRRWDGPNTVAILRAAAGRAPLPPLVSVGLVDAAAAHEAAGQPDPPAAAALLVAWRVVGPNLTAALRSIQPGVDIAEVERRVLAGANADLDDNLAAAGPDAAPVAAFANAERVRDAVALALRLHDAVTASELSATALEVVVAAETHTRISVDPAAVAGAALAENRPAAATSLAARLPRAWHPTLRAWAAGAPTAATARDLTAVVADTAMAGFATGDPLGAAIPTAWVAAKEHEALRLRRLGALATGMTDGSTH